MEGEARWRFMPSKPLLTIYINTIITWTTSFQGRYVEIELNCKWIGTGECWWRFRCVDGWHGSRLCHSSVRICLEITEGGHRRASHPNAVLLIIHIHPNTPHWNLILLLLHKNSIATSNTIYNRLLQRIHLCSNTFLIINFNYWIDNRKYRIYRKYTAFQ